MIPVSLNGLGLREGGFVYLLGQTGVASHESLALSLIVYAIVLVYSSFGWFVFVWWQRNEPIVLDVNG
jgi:hypothetical protein